MARTLSERPPAPVRAETTPRVQPEAPRSRPLLVTAWLVASWILVGVLGWLVVSVWLGFAWFGAVTVLLQSLFPIVFLPVWVDGAVALATRHWALGAACVVLVVAQVVLVVPALGSDALPAWVAAAPTVTLVSANLWNRNPTPASSAARIVATDADVLVLVEVSPVMRAALVRAGIDRRYPYQMRAKPSPTGDTDGIYSRLPFSAEHEYPLLVNRLPSVRIDVDGRPIQIVGVHIDGPLHGAGEWSGELRRLAPIARAATGPFVIAGDFNATRWNAPFRHLLSLPLTDAHESRGRGLSRSWPLRGTWLAALGPVMRVDHALVNDKVGVEHVRDIRVPGSDHLAFEVTLAVGT